MDYRLINGKYQLFEDADPIQGPLDEVAIAFDKASGTLHKHGRPEWVHNWHQQAQAKFRSHGMHDMADDLVVICGRFELEDLNRCLSTSGYVGRLYQALVNEASKASA